jgi:hypothetical protein
MQDPIRIPAALALTAALLTTTVSRADTWRPPRTFQVASQDGGYRLTVVPSVLPDRAQMRKEWGGRPTRPKATGQLERKAEGGGYETVWEQPLTNDVAPVEALVADDGTVVTLDNWHSVGLGPNVVVIYAPDGKLVRSMGVDAFLSPGEILGLTRSVSSLWWGRGHHFDEAQDVLILNVGNAGLSPGREAMPQKSVRVRLRTGEILHESPKQP